MKIIVGLGNPGLEYYSTRHNAGFRVIDQLAISSSGHFAFKKDLFCDLVKVQLGRQDVLLIKPTTFMNDSGKAVQAVLNWYKIAPSELLVVHDEVAIPLGRLRIQKNGGAGGHHGIESIMSHLGGFKDFERVRVGVGPDPGGDVRARYLLSALPPDDRDVYIRCIDTAAEAVRTVLNRGVTETMNKYNGLQLDDRKSDEDGPANDPPNDKA